MGWVKIPISTIFNPKQYKTIPIENLSKDGYTVYGANGKIGKYDEYTHEFPTLMVTCRGATCGNIHISEPFSYINGNAMALDCFINPSDFNLKYWYYFFQFRKFNDVITGSAQPQITATNLKNIELFFAPKAEQDHIATLLDNHLFQVATIRQKLNDILPIIKQFRQSVLVQAVSGRLTEDWRENNSENYKITEFGKEKIKENLFNIAKSTLPDLPNSWGVYPLGELSNYVTSGSRGWADYYSDNGAIFFRMSNVRYDTTKLDLDDLQFVNLPDNVEGKRSLIEKDDLIISITADVGRVARIDKDYGEAYINQHLALVRPIKEINAEFLAKCICSQNVGILQVNALKRGATKAGLGLDDIRSLAIPVPPLSEQQQIVAIVEQLFALADNIEKQVNEALERVSYLTQSILHQAFTGNLSADWRKENAELITGEHSATALLAQISLQKQSSQKKEKQIKTRCFGGVYHIATKAPP